MREFSVSQSFSIPGNISTADSVFRHAEEDPTFVPFKRPSNGGWVDVTAAEFAKQVSAVAKGLIASGVELGDRVAILSATRYEWVVL
ncbi:MAG: long-chain acyl-CoA synthetase, partial [Rhodococcus sp. (in: high G+C Gram-positive bacteria)]